jgi:hypothetical protein
VKTFGRFSSHRCFEHQKNIFGRIFQPGDRQTVSFLANFWKETINDSLREDCVARGSRESEEVVVSLPGDDCPYAASDRASTAAIDSAMSHPTRDLLTMSLTYLMFAAFLIPHYFHTTLRLF